MHFSKYVSSFFETFSKVNFKHNKFKNYILHPTTIILFAKKMFYLAMCNLVIEETRPVYLTYNKIFQEIPFSVSFVLLHDIWPGFR